MPNPLIPLSGKLPEFESPVNQLMRVLQVQGAQQDQALTALKMQDLQSGRQEMNALARIAADPRFTKNGRFDYAAAAPDVYRVAPTKGPGFLKGVADQRKAEADAGKTEAEMNEHQWKLLGSMTNVAAADPRPETVSALLDQWQGITGRNPSVVRQAFAQLSTPQQIRELALRINLEAKEQLTAFAPKPTQVDNGQQIAFRDTNPNSPTYGQATAGGAVQKVADPNAILSSQTSTANNQRSVGASLANAAATREVAAATRDAASLTDKRNAEMKIADDYRAQSKPFKEVSDAYRTISTSLDQATTSPAATLAGATKFMKLLDPGSVVRESELGMALAATGVFDRAANYVNTLRLGKVLTAQQAADFKNIAGQIYGAAAQQQKMVDANYTRVANQYGLRPNMIVQDLGQSTATPAAAPAVSPSQFRVLGVEK